MLGARFVAGLRPDSRLLVAAVVALLVLLLVEPGGGIVSGDVGVSDPSPGQVGLIAVDMDTDGNPVGYGGLVPSIESSGTTVVGFTREIDIIVDEVDPSDGMYAVEFNLAFDPAVVRIVSQDFRSYMFLDGVETFLTPLPDASGERWVQLVQSSLDVSGEGVLIRFGIECVAAGTSILALGGAESNGGLPNILTSISAPLSLNVSTSDGSITCVTGPTPTPSPVPTASPSSTPAVTPTSGFGTNDPVPGRVNEVAIDMDATGNPAGSGGLIPSVQSSAAIAAGHTIEIDVVVDDIHPADGMSGFGFNLKFDPDVVRIVSRDSFSYMLPGGFEVVPAPFPDETGNWRIDVGQIGGNVSGEGVLVRIGIECIGVGVSILELSDLEYSSFPGLHSDGLPDIVDGAHFGLPLPVLSDRDGEITCLQGDIVPTPTGTPTGIVTPTQRFSPPLPTPTPTPPPTPTLTPSPTPTATLVDGVGAPAPADPVAGFPSTGDGSVPVRGSLLRLMLILGGVALAAGAGLLGFSAGRRRP